MRAAKDVIAAIREHGEATYPEECCGFFLGRLEGFDPVESGHEVTGMLPAPNRHPDGRERRFTIDPADWLAAEREAARLGLDVVGVYHSHPDHPARPSATDLAEAAFPGLAYVIVPVHGGRAGEPTAWALAPDRSRFDPEPLLLMSTRVLLP